MRWIIGNVLLGFAFLAMVMVLIAIAPPGAYSQNIAGAATCLTEYGMQRMEAQHRDPMKEFPGAAVGTFSQDKVGNPKDLIGKGIVRGKTPRLFCFAYPVEIKTAPSEGGRRTEFSHPSGMTFRRFVQAWSVIFCVRDRFCPESNQTAVVDPNTPEIRPIKPSNLPDNSY